MTQIYRHRFSGFRGGLGGAQITVFANLGIALSGVFTGLLVARGLGAEQRGLYALIWSCFWLAFVVAEIGMPYAICHYAAGSPIAARTIWRRGILLQTPVALLMCVVAVAMASSITRAAQGDAQIVFASVPLFVLGNSIVSALMGISSRAWNVARLVQPVTYLLAIVVLTFRSPTFDLRAVLLALVGSQFVALLWCAATMRRVSARGDWSHTPPARQMLSYAFPAFLSTLPAVTTAKLDQLVLGASGHIFELGLYSVAVTVSSAVYPVAQALGATALRTLPAGGSPSDNEARHSRAADAVAWAAFVVTSVLALLSWLLAGDVLGSDFERLWVYVALLSPASWGLAFSRVKGDILRGVNKPGVAAKVDMVCMLVTVVGVIAIVPWAGAVGASVLSSVVALISAALVSRNVERRCSASPRSDAVSNSVSRI